MSRLPLQFQNSQISCVIVRGFLLGALLWLSFQFNSLTLSHCLAAALVGNQTGSISPSIESSDIPIIAADTSIPIHDWTARIQGSPYGLVQWGRSDCTVCVGNHSLLLPVPAYAVVFLLCAFSVALSWMTLGLLSKCAREKRSHSAKEGVTH
jgi:hypothetical protein